MWANEALDDVRANTAAKARREYVLQKAAFRKEEAELKQHIADAKEELAVMPKRGRPSKRRKELEAFLQEQTLLATLEETVTKGSGLPRRDQFSLDHQNILDDLAQRVKDQGIQICSRSQAGKPNRESK